jgi:archaeosine synthase beta-subunit
MSDSERRIITKLHREVITVMKKIRSSTPDSPVRIDQAKGSSISEGYFQGRSISRVIIYLRSSGCFWAVRSTNSRTSLKAGCLHCEHSLVGTTRGAPIPAGAFVTQFVSEYRKYDFANFPVLCVFNEGNFFNESELPAMARREILRIISANRYIEGIALESLPEFITAEKLQETRDILGHKIFEIGIGLESSNPLVRTLCVNKPSSLSSFEAAISCAKRYCRSVAYVLIKPSFVSEAEALEDSTETVRFAFNAGADVVSLEPLSVGKYTMAGALSRAGLYRPAWLWTVIEVARIAHTLGEVRIGGDNFAPRYNQSAYNCDLCTAKVRAAIRRFNSSQDIQSLQCIGCTCKADWSRELCHKFPPLIERIPVALERIAPFVRG